MLTPVATAVVVLYPGATSNATPVACRDGPTVQWTGIPGGSPVEETHHLLEGRVQRPCWPWPAQGSPTADSTGP